MSSIGQPITHSKSDNDLFSEIGNQDINDIINQMKTDIYKPIIDQMETIKSLKELVFEDKEILEYFSNKIEQKMSHIISEKKSNPKIKVVGQLFEAWIYEHRLRIKEKVKKILDLEELLSEGQDKLKNSEKLVNRLRNEINLYQQLNEIKIKRQFGKIKPKEIKKKGSEENDIYDWVVDIDLLTNINKDGWKIRFSKKFLESSTDIIKNHIIGIKSPNNSNDSTQNSSGNNTKMVEDRDSQNDKLLEKENQKMNSSPVYDLNQNRLELVNNHSNKNRSGTDFHDNKTRRQIMNKDKSLGTWEGAIVSVVGLYDKGKTFVLNNLAESNLPSGKKVTTAGLSFKYVDIEKGTKLILLDTAGSYSPVKITSDCSIIEKEATEMFILDLVFDVSDYFIFVVNDFTSLDQRYLDKLTRSLQSTADKSFREVIGRLFNILILLMDQTNKFKLCLPNYSFIQ